MKDHHLTFPSRSRYFRRQLVDNGTVLYDEKEDKAYSFNFTASFIWVLCDGNHSVYDISLLLAEHFGKNVDEVLPDVKALIGEMKAMGMLSV